VTYDELFEEAAKYIVPTIVRDVPLFVPYIDIYIDSEIMFGILLPNSMLFSLRSNNNIPEIVKIANPIYYLKPVYIQPLEEQILGTIQQINETRRIDL
jgi:hypothetical protein